MISATPAPAVPRATAHPTLVWAIAAAWAVAVAAQVTGRGQALHHDGLLQGGLASWAALGLFLLAWQVMIAAMLPSSPAPHPSVRPGQRQPTQAATGQGGVPWLFAALWTGFGVAAFLGDLGIHRLVDRWSWLATRPALLGGAVLLLAGAFQFSTLKDRCLRVRRTRAVTCCGITGEGRARRFGWARATACSVWAAAGPDAGGVRRWRGQPVVDGGADRGHGVREDRPGRTARRAADRARPHRVGDPRARRPSRAVLDTLDALPAPPRLATRPDRDVRVQRRNNGPTDWRHGTGFPKRRPHKAGSASTTGWRRVGGAVLHPKDFTPVCTTELGYMAKVKPEFDRRGVKIIGLSVDPVGNHAKWASDIEQTQGHAPNYPIIGDADFHVSKLYGMLPATTSGDPLARTPADNQTVRNVFVIGPDKKVKLVLVYPMTTGRNFDEVLRVIDSLQLTTTLGGDAGELAAGRGRHHRRLGLRRRSPQELSGGLEGAAALPSDRAPAALTAGQHPCGRAG